MTENPSDKVREGILKHLFAIHQKARGIKSTGTGMRDLKDALKSQGFKEQEIVSNLDYLTQTQWVLRDEEEFPLRRGGIIIKAKNVTYKISEKGINHFQGPSKFQTVHKFENIKVMNVQGVTVIGENNVVYNQHADLFRHLDVLDTEIQKSDRLSDADKLSVHADIETIKSQLGKPKPTKEILSSAWKGVQAAATVAGVIGLCQTIAPLIAHLL
jgi:hypothetical protein